MSQKKGFTLIELIIVIALIALLATTVILVINPVKIFKEARDSQRIADIGQMNSAMSLYAATATLPGTNPFGDAANCYAFKIPGQTIAAGCGDRYGVRPTSVANASTSQAVDAGWVPVNLTLSANGAPISAWPVDPKPIWDTAANATNTSYYYAYAPSSSNNWEFSANMESTRYASSGTDDVESTDGGNWKGLFEVGTDVSL